MIMLNIAPTRNQRPYWSTLLSPFFYYNVKSIEHLSPPPEAGRSERPAKPRWAGL